MQLSHFQAVINNIPPTHEVTHFNIEGRPYDVGTKGRYTWSVNHFGFNTLLKFVDNSSQTVIYTEVDYVYEIDVNPKPV